MAYNSSEETQRLGILDPLALDAIYDPQARQQWLSQQLESDGIGIQALTRFLGADDIANQKLSTAAAPNGELRRSPLSFFYAWNAGASGFRETAEFKEIAKFWNLDDYWREYGFPPLCRPLGDQDFDCD